MLTIYFLQGGSGRGHINHRHGGCDVWRHHQHPALGAAQQTVLQVDSSAYEVSQQMSMGYAAAYPLGVVGIICTMIAIKLIFKVNIDDEIKEVEDEKSDSTQTPEILTFKVTNELVSGLSMFKLHTPHQLQLHLLQNSETRRNNRCAYIKR